VKQTIIMAILVAASLSCKKGLDNSSTDLVQVTYEVRTSSVPLHSRYIPDVRMTTINISEFTNWTITSPGVFSKTVKLERGQVAEITGAHATSNNWSLRIKNRAGRIVAVNEPIGFVETYPGFYYSVATWRVQ
jgi:hypothetical protein